MSSQPHFLGSMTLKALLEDPNLKNPPFIGQSGNQAKVKKEDGHDGQQYNYGSAFLGPALWDKSYGTDLNLEYMDLDEFLSENTIPIIEDEVLADIDLTSKIENSGVKVSTPPVVSSPRQYLRTPPMSPSQYIKGSPINTATTAAIPSSPPSQFPSQSPQSQSPQSHDHTNSSSPSSPVSPFKVEFQVSEQDLALTNIPDYDDPRYYSYAQSQRWIQSGDDHRPKMGASFDPRKSNFSEEELKPQPIMKKSKKIFVPDDLKDEKYWARRVKNNYAAKRSRDARRVKENQIALRAAYLEKENKCLKDEMSKMRKENAKLKSIVEKYKPEKAGSWPDHSS